MTAKVIQIVTPHDDARELGGRRMNQEDGLPAHHITICATCGIPYTPARTWHRHCRTCYAWHRAGYAIGIAARALRGAA